MRPCEESPGENAAIRVTEKTNPNRGYANYTAAAGTYSSKCVEQEFCEFRLYGVLRITPPLAGHNDKIHREITAGWQPLGKDRLKKWSYGGEEGRILADACGGRGRSGLGGGGRWRRGRGGAKRGGKQRTGGARRA